MPAEARQHLHSPHETREHTNAWIFDVDYTPSLVCILGDAVIVRRQSRSCLVSAFVASSDTCEEMEGSGEVGMRKNHFLILNLIFAERLGMTLECTLGLRLCYLVGGLCGLASLDLCMPVDAVVLRRAVSKRATAADRSARSAIAQIAGPLHDGQCQTASLTERHLVP